MNEQERQRFKELLEAMQAQLQASEAGLKESARCLGCGNVIDPERLAFDPTITLCITCARNASRR